MTGNPPVPTQLTQPPDSVRPWLGYWPDPADDPGVDLGREPMWAVSPDGAIVRGVLWTPPGGRWTTGVILAHPRGDFSVHYAAPLLAAAGFAVLGIATRYVNNDMDCLHESAALDVVTAAQWLRERGAEWLVALGNCGGGPLTALAQARHDLGADLFIALAAHAGEGEIMSQVIDPSVTDENDPFSADPTLDMYHPDNGWRPWPAPASYDPDWLSRYRSAQRARIARIDARANATIDSRRQARERAGNAEPGTAEWVDERRRSVFGSVMTIHRTLANPAYLDPTIEPDDRPLGTIFVPGDPLVGNSGYGGLGRVMTARGWLSTWSALSSAANTKSSMPLITCPTLVIHPTADTEIRLSEADAIASSSGSDDIESHRLEGSPHYLAGHRVEAACMMADWINERR